VNTDVRDALPDLVHGRLDELNTATMLAHVESCAECRAELELMRAVRESASLLPPMNIDRIASAIRPYGGVDAIPQVPARQAPGRLRSYTLMATLAVLAFAFGGALLTNRSKVASAPVASRVAVSEPTAVASESTIPATAASPASAVKNNGSAAPSREVQVAALSFVGGTQDLSESELETLLSEIEGMESIPSAEPQSVTPSIEDIEGGQ
jgi:anti-sigma factor RsiW